MPKTKDDFIDELRYYMERTPTTREVELYWNRFINQSVEKDQLTWIKEHVEEEDDEC